MYIEHRLLHYFITKRCVEEPTSLLFSYRKTFIPTKVGPHLVLISTFNCHKTTAGERLGPAEMLDVYRT